MIKTNQVTPKEVANIQIGNNFAAGVYNIIVSQNENMNTLRMVKK